MLREAEFLIATRKAINIKLRQMNHWELMYCRANEPKVEVSKQRISDLHAAVEDNLADRTTRAAKNAAREKDGVQTIVMENKYSAKQKRVRAVPPKRRDVYDESNDE